MTEPIKPEVLRLAEWLSTDYSDDVRVTVAAAELRRLHAEVERLRADHATLLDNASIEVRRLRAESNKMEAEVERLRADAADFHMAYRMKCDEETKAQAVEIERLRAELARLTTPVPLLEREETGGCILWARDEDGWFESARIGATHWTPLPNVKEPK
jgi:predicted RNase H-like nuclease (RuvC/YqgF family)